MIYIYSNDNVSLIDLGIFYIRKNINKKPQVSIFSGNKGRGAS